jgi:hypothetical protein
MGSVAIAALCWQEGACCQRCAPSPAQPAAIQARNSFWTAPAATGVRSKANSSNVLLCSAGAYKTSPTLTA